jgi:opacity protein-like surface antigen
MRLEFPARPVLLLSVACLSACASVDTKATTRDGFYLGVGGVGVLDDFDLDDEEDFVGGNIHVDDPLGGEGRVGYRFLPVLGVEADFQAYDDFTFEAGGTDIAEGNGWAASANLKGFLLPGPLQPYVLAGFGMMSFDFDSTGTPGGTLIDDNDMFWRFGAGLDAYASENVVLYGECTYNIPLDNLEDFNFFAIAAGIQFRF